MSLSSQKSCYKTPFLPILRHIFLWWLTLSPSDPDHPESLKWQQNYRIIWSFVRVFALIQQPMTVTRHDHKSSILLPPPWTQVPRWLFPLKHTSSLQVLSPSTAHPPIFLFPLLFTRINRRNSSAVSTIPRTSRSFGSAKGSMKGCLISTVTLTHIKDKKKTTNEKKL